MLGSLKVVAGSKQRITVATVGAGAAVATKRRTTSHYNGFD